MYKAETDRESARVRFDTIRERMREEMPRWHAQFARDFGGALQVYAGSQAGLCRDTAAAWEGILKALDSSFEVAGAEGEGNGASSSGGVDLGAEVQEAEAAMRSEDAKEREEKARRAEERARRAAEKAQDLAEKAVQKAQEAAEKAERRRMREEARAGSNALCS